MSTYLAWMPSAMTFWASAGDMPHLNLPASSPTARALAACALGWPADAFAADFLANAGVAANSAIAQAMRIMVVMWALYHASMTKRRSRYSGPDGLGGGRIARQ